MAITAITYSQIPSTSLGVNVFMTSGYTTPGDLGAGAIFTSQDATSVGPMAVQDASLVWYNLVIPGGVVNPGWFGYTGLGGSQDTSAVLAAQNASLTGKSIILPTLPIQNIVETNYTFSTADFFSETRRSNSGTAMGDTFPASSVNGLTNGTTIAVDNVDSIATLTISAGLGTQINGGPTAPIGPGRSTRWVYDTTGPTPNWRPTSNSLSSLLAANSLSEMTASQANTALINIGGARSTLTRAQIPSSIIGVPTVVLGGFTTEGDLGAGAIYTSQGATSGSPMAIQDSTGTWYQLVTNGLVNAGWFGATGNGSTNDTTALQTLITYIQTNHLTAFLPAGTYKISASLNFSCIYGWGIIGAGRYVTTIKQSTDNIAIFNLGSDSISYMHSWRIESLGFDYTNNQPSTNTSAIPILFSQMGYESIVRDIMFIHGSYGIAVASGINAPWGCTWDDLWFGPLLSIGAINFSLGISGIPNNHFGRIYIVASNMIGPCINLKGYNCVIDTIEFNGADQGANLITWNSGGEVTIGAIKLENGTYATSGSLLTFPHDCHVRIGQLFVGGNGMYITGGSTTIYVMTLGGGVGGPAFCRIDSISVSFTSIQSGSVAYFFSAPNSSQIEVGTCFPIQDSAVQLVYQGGGNSGETVTICDQMYGKLSQNLGDANDTIVIGGPNIRSYTTPFTAQRTITLPGTNATVGNLFNGLYYEMVFNGAINGANNALIVCNGVTLLTQTYDKCILRFTYRRGSTSYAPQTGWILIKQEPIGMTSSQGYSTNNSTSASTVLIAADIFGGLLEHSLGLTGAITSASNAQLPTVANLVSPMATFFSGQTYKLRVINSGGSSDGIWTLTTNTGWTLSGVVTIPPGTYRDFYVTLTSLTTATLQSIGSGGTA